MPFVKRRSAILLVGLVGALAVARLVYCELSLERRIARHITKAGGRDFSVAGATDFAWEQMFVFPPYSSGPEIQKRLGFRWTPPAGDDIGIDDGIVLLVFVQSGSVVDHAAVSRGEADFSEVPDGPYSPETAIFRVVHRDEWPYVEARHSEFAAEPP